MLPLSSGVRGLRMTIRSKQIAALVLLVLAGTLSLYALLNYYSPVSISVIDRDGSGLVSLFEAIDSYDVGSRPSESNPGCTEIFWLKDGLPATLECP